MNRTVVTKPLRPIMSDDKNRRRNNRKLKFSKQVPRRGRFDIYADAGKQALKDLNYLRRFINTETQYTDAVVNGASSGTTATFTLLNGTSQGDGVSNRTGQSIKVVKIDLNVLVKGNQSGTSQAGRILVVMDKQPNAAIFAIGDLLNATTVTSMFTIGGQKRFAVLLDEVYAININGTFTYYYRGVVKCASHVEYNTGNAGTVADINSNSIYLLHFSDDNINQPTVKFYSRLWFVDN